MNKEQDRRNIVRQIQHAADLYKRHLVGKRFMYVFDGQFIEVIYKTENFRHLTGVATALSAKRFYSYASRHMLAASQIWFNNVHPYDLCVRKVQHLGEIAMLAGSESFMLEEIRTHTQSYKFGTTDLNFTLCMNRELDDSGNVKGDCFVVQSLRDEDCFSKSKDAYVVSHIFSRPNDSKKYCDLIYEDAALGRQRLPEKVLALIDEGCIREEWKGE